VHHVYVVPPAHVSAVRQPLAVITPTDILFLFDAPPAELGAAATMRRTLDEQ
jgi:hypothetical protein